MLPGGGLGSIEAKASEINGAPGVWRKNRSLGNHSIHNFDCCLATVIPHVRPY